MDSKAQESAVTRTLALASMGGALEFYDFVIFVFLIAPIGRLFFPPELPEWSRQFQSFALFAAGYFVRPLGGLVMAHFGDTRGRKGMFTLSVALMATPTFVIAILPTYRNVGVLAPITLLLLRIVQGVAIGGEAPGAWVFVAEHAKAGRTGFAVGMLTAGLSSGILLGSIIATSLNSLLTPQQIESGWWRLPFAIGGLLGAAAAFLRRWLAETPVFIAIRTASLTAKSLPLKIVVKSYLGAVSRAFVLTFFLTAMIVVVILLTPSLLHQQFHISVATSQVANIYGSFGLCLGVLIFGWASDLIGVRRVAALTVPTSAVVTYLLFSAAKNGSSHLDGWYLLAGIGAGCSVLTPIVILKLFAPQVRFTGFALSYNLAYAVFGGVTPIVIAALSRRDPMAAPHFIAIAAIFGLISLLIRVDEPRNPIELSTLRGAS